MRLTAPWSFPLLPALVALLAALPARAGERTADWPRDPETGVLRGAEPFELTGDNGRAVLLIHGFSSSPREMRALGERLHEAGFTVKGIRLKGHGTTPQDLRGARWEDWYAQTEAAFRELREGHEEVSAVGFSLGGALALHLAAREELERVTGLGTHLGLTHKWYYVVPLEWHVLGLGRLLPYINKSDRWIKVNDRSQVAGHIAYSRLPSRAVRSLLSLARRVRREASRIEEPLLIIHARGDDVASIKAARRFYESAASAEKRFVTLERSNHLITLDFEKEQVFAEVAAFLNGGVRR